MGQAVARFDISNITSAKPALVTTAENHSFITGNLVRITDLNGMIPIPRGLNQINNGRFEIIVTDTDQFTLKDPVTKLEVDTTSYAPYVTGGLCNLVQTEFEYTAE